MKKQGSNRRFNQGNASYNSVGSGTRTKLPGQASNSMYTQNLVNLMKEQNASKELKDQILPPMTNKQN